MVNKSKSIMPYIGLAVVLIECMAFRFATFLAYSKGYWPLELCQFVNSGIMVATIVATLWLAQISAYIKNQ